MHAAEAEVDERAVLLAQRGEVSVGEFAQLQEVAKYRPFWWAGRELHFGFVWGLAVEPFVRDLGDQS